MSKLTELIDTALRAAQSKATAASIWSDSSKELKDYSVAYDEARAALAAEVQRVEADNKRMREALEYVVAVYDKGTCGHTVEIAFNKCRAAIGETK